jgi:pimeloyl-ACP methyl ester carboxylesterase
MMFPRGQIEPLTRSRADWTGLETIWLDSPWGRTEAWFLPPADGPSVQPYPVVIFAHGNAERIDDWVQELSPFTRLGVGLLLVEYPGYGRSHGRPSQSSITDVMVAAYDRLAARRPIDPGRIVLMGRSIGGGAVCQLASRRPAAALILMSTFTSARAFASRYLAPGFLVKDPFDNLAVLQGFNGPVLLMHGRNDDVIPFYHAQRLHRAARNVRLIAYPCGHNDCPPRWDVFWKDIEGFLHESGLLNRPRGDEPSAG